MVSYFSCALLGSFPMYKKLGTVQLKKNHFVKHPSWHGHFPCNSYWNTFSETKVFKSIAILPKLNILKKCEMTLSNVTQTTFHASLATVRCSLMKELAKVDMHTPLVDYSTHQICCAVAAPIALSHDRQSMRHWYSLHESKLKTNFFLICRINSDFSINVARKLVK